MNRAVHRGTEEPCAPELPLCTVHQEAPAAERQAHIIARLEQVASLYEEADAVCMKNQMHLCGAALCKCLVFPPVLDCNTASRDMVLCTNITHIRLRMGSSKTV
ncbi:hypothetical protein NDU88_005633 [Pleurodeles waltl]|uniref:Uncharacterized protein n=1 Tax=Pleurodeles waltl TaxID=8319 RepID=A0AAV7VNR6_PLEWA|nr:hypothetical protein NDU88_005633 [Pleurodeles waltl]